MASRFWHLFQPDEGHEGAVRASLDAAHEVLNFAAHPHFERFMEWLQKEWDKPKAISDHNKLVEQVTRENTLKEVYQHLQTEIVSAQRLLESNKEQ